jgi:hypothetical protein
LFFCNADPDEHIYQYIAEKPVSTNALTGFININNEHFFIFSGGAETDHLRITPSEYVLEIRNVA